MKQTRKAKAPRARAAQRRDGAGGPSRDNLLNAAVQVFAKHGYEGASVQKMADIAGVGQPLFHYHFGSKEQLWQAAARDVLDRADEFFSAASGITVDVSPIDRLRILARAIVQLNSRRPEAPLIVLNEVRSAGERLDWLVENYLGRFQSVMDGLVEEAIAAGQMRALEPMYFTNFLLLAASQMAIFKPLYEALYRVDLSNEEVEKKAADHLMMIVFQGVCPSQPAAAETP